MVDVDEYFLPVISVKLDVSPHEFLVRMEEIAEHTDNIRDVRKNFSSDESCSNLSLSFMTGESNGLVHLYSTFTVSYRDEKRIEIELASESWGESSPTYEEYVGCFKRYLKPLLSIYNKKYNTNRRFRIPTKEKLEPKLSEIADSLFQRFINDANKTFLGQYSWIHFYEFIISSHHRNERLSSKQLEYLLKKAEFNDFYCEKLCSIYEHGWSLLEQLPESKIRAWRKRIHKQMKDEREKQSSGPETEE